MSCNDLAPRMRKVSAVITDTDCGVSMIGTGVLVPAVETSSGAVTTTSDTLASAA